MLEELLENQIFWSAFWSWFVAQVIKIMINLYTFKKLDFKLILSSGGMPSSHSSFVIALAVSTGLIEGFQSTYFAICAVLSMVVMYDAAGVRRAAGKQAEVLNILVDRFMEKTGLENDGKLKELLGHTPVEVACGAILGTGMAMFFYLK